MQAASILLTESAKLNQMPDSGAWKLLLACVCLYIALVLTITVFKPALYTKSRHTAEVLSGGMKSFRGSIGRIIKAQMLNQSKKKERKNEKNEDKI